MKNKKARKDSRGLKTFFIYAFIVGIVIFVSLSIKAFLIFQNNKYDGKHISILISQNERIVAVAGYNSVSDSSSYLKIDNGKLHDAKEAINLGILYDAKIDSSQDLSNNNLASVLKKAAFKQESAKTNLTIFDLIHLLYLSKNAKETIIKLDEGELIQNDSTTQEHIEEIFKNDSIASENISIKVVNATGRSGLGNNMERSLSNMGANVVAVSSARDIEKYSKIQYFGQESYTLKKLRRILKFPTENLNEKSIADIIIIIGEDSKEKSGL